jgi:hypothetical protein
MSKKLGLDNNTRNKVYSGKFTGEEDASNPLKQFMKPSGNQTDTSNMYLDNQRQVFGTKTWGLNVEKADQVRFNSVRYVTHGRNPPDDDQKTSISRKGIK